MNTYQVTLTAISTKRVRIAAASEARALELVTEMYFQSPALDFVDDDVCSVTVDAAPLEAQQDRAIYGGVPPDGGAGQTPGAQAEGAAEETASVLASNESVRTDSA